MSDPAQTDSATADAPPAGAETTGSEPAQTHSLAPVPPEPAAPRRNCMLEHPGFTAMGTPTFRRSEGDGVAVMTVALGNQEAVMPLDALQRALGITDSSPDGQMLAMIIESLDFVDTLRMGDPLPIEVVTGQASWTPEPHHYALAAARLRLHLVQWLGRGEAGGGAQPDPAALLALVEDPGFRPRLAAAFHSAAIALGLPASEDVIPLLGRLSEELAYIEAMRERLLDRVDQMNGRIAWVVRTGRGGWQRNEMLLSVQRLMADALDGHRKQFEEIDRQTSNVVDALRDMQMGRLGVSVWRDGMFISLRRWDELIVGWERCAQATDPELGRLIDRTYRFLARRSMPGSDWAGVVQERSRQMSW